MSKQVPNSVRHGRGGAPLVAIGATMAAVRATACGTATPRSGAPSPKGVQPASQPVASPSKPTPPATSFQALIARATGLDTSAVDVYDSATQKLSTIPTTGQQPPWLGSPRVGASPT